MTAFLLVTGLFLLWGVANNLKDVLVRQFMKSFELQRLQAGLVQSEFYIGYFSFSVPAAMLMQRHGYKFGLVTGEPLTPLEAISSDRSKRRGVRAGSTR